MRFRIIPFVLPLAAAAAAACDPMAGVTLRQRLAPAPAIACVRAALAASPAVTGVGQAEYLKALPGYQFQVFVHDSVAPHAMPPFIRLLVPARDSATLEVAVDYFGATTSRVTPEVARRSAAAAGVLARAVHDSCAPDAPTTLTCKISGAGRSRPCPPAA